MYRCEATSVAGFIQPLAVAYVAHGYWFYVTGEIPAHKDPRAVDAKLIARYDLDVSKWTRCRRGKNGTASVQYLRHRRFFVLIATQGKHLFFREELDFKDVRRIPIRFHGYSVGCARGRDGVWHSSVRIARAEFSRLKTNFMRTASHWTVQEFEENLRRLPFEPYAPVRRQLYRLLGAVNRLRKSSGNSLVSPRVLRTRRRPTKPFVAARSTPFQSNAPA